jgi:hypothetical protein
MVSLAGFRVDCSLLVGACGVTFLINGISPSLRTKVPRVWLTMLDAEGILCVGQEGRTRQRNFKPKDLATQAFWTYGKCIFDGKRTKLKQTDDIHEESHGRQTCYQGQKLVETGRRKRMRGADQYAMLGATKRAHQ